MAKLGHQFPFLWILSLGLIYFPNQYDMNDSYNSYKIDLDLSRASCLGVERLRTVYNQHDSSGGYRRTIGSGLFYKPNPEMWKNYDMLRNDPNTANSKGPEGSWYFRHITIDEPMQVELYWIKVDGRFLNGWLHVVVKTTGPSARDFGILQMHGVIDFFAYAGVGNGLQMDINSVELGEGGFGEFVHDFPSCTDAEHKNDLKPTKNQYMPCGGIPERGQTMPWGFEYVEPMNGTDSDYLVQPGPPHREFHMNFRFASQPCSHPIVIRFGAIAYFPTGTWLAKPDEYYSSNNGPDHRWRYGVSDEFELKDDHVVGASDPVPRPGTYTSLDCSTRINSSSTPKFVKRVQLIRRQRLFEYGCSEAGTRDFFSSIADPGETALFGGRCHHNGANNYYWSPDRASTARVNQCKHNTETKDPSTGVKAIEYKKHLQNLTNNLDSLCAPCPTVPPRPSTTARTKPTLVAVSTAFPKPPDSPEENFMTDDLKELKLGVEINNNKALEIWDTRILHGICMTILSIFVSPINIFITRYFKETFLGTRILYLRIWYFIHHSAIVASAILYGAGHWRLVSRRALAGVSLAEYAMLHRSCGWASIGIMSLLALIGGFRPIERALRTYFIAAHWLIGMTIYFMNYALMMISVWIPASPFATIDSSIVFEHERSHHIENQILPLLVICWIAFDVMMHVSMTIHVCNMDKRLKLTRPRYWLPVPISVLPEDATQDMIGSHFRKLMLALYGVVALAVTVTICCMLCTMDPKGRGLGEMSCTHGGHEEYWLAMGKKRCQED